MVPVLAKKCVCLFIGFAMSGIGLLAVFFPEKPVIRTQLWYIAML